MLNARQEKIALLLAQGISQENTAARAGCTPAYVSQLLRDENFKERVMALRDKDVTEKTEEELLDTKYESMEHRLLNAMEAALPGADLRDITNALKTVGDRQNARAKIKAPVNTAGNNTNIAIVQIGLPQKLIPTLTMNAKNEVVAIDDRPMAPMTSQGVASLFQSIKAAKEGTNGTVIEAATSVLKSVPADF